MCWSYFKFCQNHFGRDRNTISIFLHLKWLYHSIPEPPFRALVSYQIAQSHTEDFKMGYLLPEAFGNPADEIKQIDPDPIVPLRYSCACWIDHLYSSDHVSSVTYVKDFQDKIITGMFFGAELDVLTRSP